MATREEMANFERDLRAQAFASARACVHATLSACDIDPRDRPFIERLGALDPADGWISFMFADGAGRMLWLIGIDGTANLRWRASQWPHGGPTAAEPPTPAG